MASDHSLPDGQSAPPLLFGPGGAAAPDHRIPPTRHYGQQSLPPAGSGGRLAHAHEVDADDLTAAIGNACLRNNTPLTKEALADAAGKALDMVDALKKAPASVKPAVQDGLSAAEDMLNGNGENGLPNPLLGTPACKNMNKAAARVRS